MKKFNIYDDTARAKMYRDSAIERANLLQNDPEKKVRIDDNSCVVCFYGSRCGGAAITTSKCKECGKEMTFGSTCVDKYCDSCASRFLVCKQCGADIGLVNRRGRGDDGILRTTTAANNQQDGGTND
ncbi:MAG: hypothetical protein ACYTBJ_26400 [Planctomycetota bacterium]|jgi:hypothetical protein